MEAEIERIGVLRNPIVSWEEAHGEPAPAAACAGNCSTGCARRRREHPGRNPPPTSAFDESAPATSGQWSEPPLIEERPVSWPRDDAKLDRVRALMARARARRARRPGARQRPLPDELLGDEGLRRGRLPARGRADPRSASRRARRTRRAWPGRATSGSSAGYDPADPRPPLAAHARARARRRAAEYDASASSSRSARRRPTAWSASRRRSRTTWFDAFGPRSRTRRRSSPRRARSRREQEIERMRLANEIAAAAMEHCRLVIEPGHERGADRRRVGGLRPRRGHGLGGQGRARARLLARLVGPGDPDVHRDDDRPVVRRTSRRCSRSGSAPTATGATTRRTSSSGSSTPRVPRARGSCSASTSDASTSAGPARASPSSTGASATGSPRWAFPGQPSHPIAHGVGARAHEPPYAHQAGGGEIARGHGACNRARMLYRGGGGLRVEDNFLITAEGAEKLSPLPRWDSPGVTLDRRRSGRATSTRRRSSRSRTSSSASTTRPCATASRRSASSSRRRTSSRSPARSTRQASTGSRPASPASRTTTSRAFASSPRRACEAESGASPARSAPTSRRSSSSASRASVIESPISDGKLRALGVSREAMLERIRSAVAFAVEHGIRVAFFGVDSTPRRPRVLPPQAYEAAVEAGAQEVVVVDTLGIATPEAAAFLVGEVAERLDHDGPDPLARARRLRPRHRGRRRGRAGRRDVGARDRQRDGGAGRQRRPRRGRAGARGALRHPDAPPPRAGAGAVATSCRSSPGTRSRPWKPVTGDNLFTRESGAVAAQFHDPPAIEPYASELVGAERGHRARQEERARLDPDQGGGARARPAGGAARRRCSRPSSAQGRGKAASSTDAEFRRIVNRTGARRTV